MRFKLTSLAILAMGLGYQAQAQKWKTLLSEGAPYSEIVSTFEKEWGDKPYERHQGFKPYYRYKNFWEPRLTSKGEIPSKRGIYQAHAQYMSAIQPLVTGDEDAGFWRTEGPFNHVNTDSWSHGQGRVNAVIEDPNDANTIYVGAPDGGLWKSTDAGATWVALIDHFSRLGISDIVIDPNDSQTIYIATGDADGGDAVAIGVWKSTDGGTTWAEAGNITSSRIYKIEMDPDDSNRLLAAANNGMYRTTDGGSTWTEVYTEKVRDVQFGVGAGTQNAFAVTGGSFIRSTDNGATWTEITSGIPTDFNHMRLDVTKHDANYIYVVAAGSANSGTQYSGVYKSTDAGLNFTQIHSPDSNDLFNGSGQAWYDLDIAVDENDKNTLMVGVLNIWRSTDGGVTWEQINNWSTTEGPAYTHADIHYLKWHGNNVYCGSDGGIYKSTNDGSNFTDLTAGLPIGQYYDIDVYQNDPSYMAGGLQDNGGYYFDGIWKNYYGADGMVALFNPEDSANVYGMIQNGGLYVTSNFGETNQGLGNPGVDGQWVTPMEWDKANNRVIAGYDKLYERTSSSAWNAISTYTFPSNLGEIELYNDETNTMLVSTNYDGVFYTTDGGANWSNVITNMPNNTNYIKDIEFDEADSSHFFVLQSYNVYETTDAGATWSEISGSLPSTVFNDIEMDHSQTNKSLYIATDIAVHYYNTTLGDWIPFNNNLPNVVVSDIEILPNFDAIRIGTYGRGIYASRLYDKTIHKSDAQALTAGFGVDTLCAPQELPMAVEFKNRAWDTINSISYEVLVDNISIVSSTWNGELLPFQKVELSTPDVNLTAGNHDVRFVLFQPNGIADSYQLNDTIETSIFVDNGVDENTVNLSLGLDDYAHETSWILLNAANDTIDIRPLNYYNGQNNTIDLQKYCLEDGCYTFKIQDSYEDYGSQYSMILAGGVEIFQHSGNFGAENEHQFCLPMNNQAPEAAFVAEDSTLCLGTEIQFTDSSDNNVISWAWTFAGGTPSVSTDQNPLVTYNNSGTFDVQLIVTNPFGTDTLSTTALIEVYPEIEYNYNQITDPTQVCMDSVINILSPVNPASNYSYEWLDMGGNIVSSTDTFIAYTPGFYQYQVTDENGCTSDFDTVTVILNDIEITFDIVASQCLGFDNGTINTTITGGAAPYEITWSDTNLGTDLNLTDLQAGDYTIEVVDTNGCIATATATVENQLNFNFNLGILNHVTCLGGNNGAVGLTISGGQPPYTYVWSFSPLMNVDTVYNAPAGDHTVTITDNNGCMHIEEFTIDDGYQATIIPSITNEYCENGYDGQIFLNVLGGVPPYSFQWSGGLPNSNIVGGLTAGIYSVTVLDSNGCSSFAQMEVETSHVFEASYEVTEETCDDYYDGAISATISGGVPPYTLSWLNVPGGGNGLDVDSLTTGDYYLSITGANGCNRVDTIHVGIETPIVPFFTPSDPEVYMDADPTITFMNQSTGGLSYSWSFGDGTFSTEESPTHTYTDVGEYFVKLTVFNGYCSREYTLSINVYPNIGLEDIDFNSFEILPNPNQGSFSIEIVKDYKEGRIEIYDVTGRLVHKQDVTKGLNKFDIPELTKGSYLVNLIDGETRITTEKLVID